MTTSQRLIEHELDAAIKSTQSMRHCAKRGVAANERICCDGGCNDNQGRGHCPRFHAQEPPSEEYKGIFFDEPMVDLACSVAIVLACVALVLLVPGPGVWQ